MPINNEFYQQLNVRKHQVTGLLSFQLLHDFLADLYKSADFKADTNALWDLREAQLKDFTANQVRKIANLVKGQWGTAANSKAAIVVSRVFSLGMAGMYEMYLTDFSPSEVQVFRDMDSALHWLTY